MEKISSSYPTRKTQFSKTVLPPHNQGMKTWYSLHISTTKAQKWTHNTFMRWNILASIRTYFSSRFFPLFPPIISRNIMIMTVVFCELSVPNLKNIIFRTTPMLPAVKLFQISLSSPENQSLFPLVCPYIDVNRPNFWAFPRMRIDFVPSFLRVWKYSLRGLGNRLIFVERKKGSRIHISGQNYFLGFFSFREKNCYYFPLFFVPSKLFFEKSNAVLAWPA